MTDAAAKAKLARVSSGQLIALEPYRGSMIPWLLQCLNCGDKKYAKPKLILRKGGCQPCAHLVSRVSQEDAEARLDELFGGQIIPRAPYELYHSPWPVECVDCGNQWAPTPSNLFKGEGCYPCSWKACNLRKRITGGIDCPPGRNLAREAYAGGPVHRGKRFLAATLRVRTRSRRPSQLDLYGQVCNVSWMCRLRHQPRQAGDCLLPSADLS
jgi:hypothetical protein